MPSAAEACSASEVEGCIDAVAIDDAKEALILARATHLDQLADKLREDRVRRIVEPLLAGSGAPGDLPPDDLDYVVDLGLVRIRRLGGDRQSDLPGGRAAPADLHRWRGSSPTGQRGTWISTGNLEVAKLMEAFQVLLSGERRALGGSIRVQGGGATTPAAGFPAADSERRRTVGAGVRPGTRAHRPAHPMARKGGPHASAQPRHRVQGGAARTRSAEGTIRTGLAQTARYMDRCRAESGHLVIFDGRQGRTWQERLFRRSATEAGKAITVWGM